MSRYANAEQWARFLAPLAACVKGNLGRDDVLARAAACAEALAIFPEWLTDTRRRDAMAKFEFWPSVAEIGELFDGDKRHAMAMRGFAQPSGLLPAPAAPPPLTDEQKAAALAQAAAFRAEMAEQVMAEAPKATARPLAPHALLSHYERLAAQGNEAAAMRAAQLRDHVA